MKKTTILFLCTGNSCRSQMAEGWARALRGDDIDPYSAGVVKHGLNPHAVTVMAEVGVDISHHTSSLIEELPIQNFEYVITLCGHANETCPFFAGSSRRMHKGFDDPPSLGRNGSPMDDPLQPYRRVRDEIRAFVLTLPHSLPPLD